MAGRGLFVVYWVAIFVSGQLCSMGLNIKNTLEEKEGVCLKHRKKAYQVLQIDCNAIRVESRGL